MQKFKPVILFVILLMTIFLFTNFARSENSDIVISEICPTGCADSGHQWLEIYNRGDEVVDMEGWTFFENDTNHGLDLSASSTQQDFLIESGEYAIIAQNDLYFFADNPDVTSTVFDSSWGTLNKSGEHITLKDGDDNILEDFSYLPINDFSLERKDLNQDDYSENNWLEHPNSHSAGQKNYYFFDSESSGGAENQAPTAIITASSSSIFGTPVLFSAKNSIDNDGEILSYSWVFENQNFFDTSEISYNFSTTGTQEVFLTVTDDDLLTATTSFVITILDNSSDGNDEDDDLNNTNSSTTSFILINEFVADPVSGEKEWVELYNPTDSIVDLSGWTLSDGVGIIASPTSTIDSQDFFVIETESSKLNNSGDIIILKNSSSTIVDQVSYGDWDDGDTSDNAPSADDPSGVARTQDGSDTDNDADDFVETTTPTKGVANQITAPINSDSDSGGGGGSTSEPTANKIYNASDIVVNEIVSDPTDGKVEFIELFNNSLEDIDLSGWYVEDGGESKSNLSGKIKAGGFFVLEKPKGNLNNSGDMVILYSPSDKEIDRVVYGKWDDGNLSDNASVADDPYSLIRKVDGRDSDNDYYDFALTGTVTPGSTNVLMIDSDDDILSDQVLVSSKIVINEVLPNPAGSDSEDEFIELKNEGSQTVDLIGYKIADASRKYEIKQGRIEPGKYFVLKRSMTSIALNNSGGEEVKFYSPNSTLLDSIKYDGGVDDDFAFARREDQNNWDWTSQATPGKENIITGKSSAPIIAIDVDTEVAVGEPVIFDASDTTDPEGEEIIFSWDFDDGSESEGVVVEHRFNLEGVYSVVLKAVDNSENETKKKVIITVKNKLDFVGGYYLDNIADIEISEFIPNPEGSDSVEFIEFFNPSADEIDLSGIKVDDMEGGSRAYTFPEGTIVLPNTYFVLGRQDSKIALNNTSDSVRLLYPDGTLIKEILYDDVVEGASYIKNEEDKWLWTAEVTPGKKNIILDASSFKTTTAIKRTSSKYIKPIISTSLEKVRDEDIGDKVRLTGIVAVLPGILASQYFYIVPENSTSTSFSGLQIYMYKKDFPSLKIGDKIEINGEISQASNNLRVKLSSKEDIKILEHSSLPIPKKLEISEISENSEGALIQVAGEITEKKSSYMYVDDGSDEVQIYFKRGAGINTKLFEVGDIVEVTGLVYDSKSGFRILPREMGDIKKTGVAEEFVTKLENKEEESKKEVAEKYLTATAGGLTSILFGLFAKARGAGAIKFFRRMSGVAVAIIRKKRG